LVWLPPFLYLFSFANALDCRQELRARIAVDERRFSLSPRQRTGVRGKEMNFYPRQNSAISNWN
jgi:hypothetical protein